MCTNEHFRCLETAVSGLLLGNISVPGPEADVGDARTSKMHLGLKAGWPAGRPLACVKCEMMTW